ncbi:MAG TPA: hypothetical protein VGH28_28585 [Polyangiaceae bacterium]|jgi:hypothetical protein
MRGRLLLLLVALATLECSNDQFCDADAGACGDSGTSVPPVSGGGCDSSKPASQGGCAVAETDGFFVAPTGSDASAGSKLAPFQTIGKGITAAAADPTRPNVYVCQGTYAENLVIQTAPAGVALHGGFDCASWTQTSAPTAVAPKSGYALHVLGAAALVESMTLTAPDATAPGASSIAAFVDGSPGMTFRRAAVTAGAGGDGATPQSTPMLAPAQAGNSNTAGNACPAVICKCATDTSTGGAGGGYFDAGTYIQPTSGLPVIGGDLDAGHAGSSGPPGNGASGAGGKAGASTGSLGELTSGGWVASPGGAGVAGDTAQGGGGIGGDPGLPQGAGAGGACGGCGGAAGKGGDGGGASIAIAAINSVVRVQASAVKAAKAGNGGNGAGGQPGQPGGTGGTGPTGAGGNGGTGGSGGNGGGGAGGISVAVATNSGAPAPDIDSSSSVLAGTPGKGGVDGAGANKAVDGLATPVHAF